MGAPYALSSDLVSAWPAKSLEVAQYIDGQVPLIAMTQNAQTGTTYTFVAADFTKLVTLSNASPVAVTVPLEATVPWVTGTQLRLLNQGAGTVTVAGAVGVTINGTPLTLTQYKGATLIKTGTNTWTFVPFSSGSAKATVTGTTGSPTITTVGTKTVYKFTGAGSITTTAGEVDVLIVSAGSASGGSDGNGGRIMSGIQTLTAATHTVAVGASGGTLSSVGPLSSGPAGRAFNSANQTGAGGTTAVPGTPLTSSIDGTSRTYAASQNFGPSSTTFGDGGSFAGVVLLSFG
jgi:hypothetical protein